MAGIFLAFALAACAPQDPPGVSAPCLDAGPDAAPPPDAGACLSCSALLTPVGSVADACAGTSQARLVGWLTCACSGLVDACAGYCAGSSSLAAAGCFDATMAAGCATAYLACTEDDAS